MKKMKKFYMSLLSLAMCGAIGLSAGCNTPGGDSISNSDNNPASESSNNNPASDNNGNEPVKVEKKDVYEDVAKSIEVMATSGETYKLSFDFDATYTAIEPIETDSGYEEISKEYSMEISGDMWFQIVEGNLSADAVINGYTSDEGVENPYAYAAMHIRSEADALYEGMLESTEEITQAQIADMGYYSYKLSGVMDEILGGGAGDVGGEEGVVAELDVEPTDSTAIPEDTEATMKEVISAMVMRVAGGFFDGINGEVTVEGTVHTLSVDVKAELTSIYDTATVLVNLIDENTTINDLLASDTLKNFFTKYFNALTVEDLNTILPLAGLEGVVLEGETAYDAIVNFVKTMPAGDEANPDATIGDMPIGEMKEQILGMLENFKTNVLDLINSLKYSISVNDGMLSGVTVDVDIENMMDVDVAVAFAEAEYTFVDVSGLKLVEAVA